MRGCPHARTDPPGGTGSSGSRGAREAEPAGRRSGRIGGHALRRPGAPGAPGPPGAGPPGPPGPLVGCPRPEGAEGSVAGGVVDPGSGPGPAGGRGPLAGATRAAGTSDGPVGRWDPGLGRGRFQPSRTAHLRSQRSPGDGGTSLVSGGTSTEGPRGPCRVPPPRPPRIPGNRREPGGAGPGGLGCGPPAGIGADRSDSRRRRTLAVDPVLRRFPAGSPRSQHRARRGAGESWLSGGGRGPLVGASGHVPR